MSSVAVEQSEPTAAPSLKPARSVVRRVLGDTFMRWGARVGLAWIALLVIFAVFGPFIASSHPIAMKVNGQWESPLLRHLSAIDVVLLVVFATTAVLSMLTGIEASHRVKLWIVIAVISSVLAFAFKTTPDLVVYESYREREAAGEITSVWRTPIPFSPNDRVRDRRGVLRPEGPSWASTIDQETGKQRWSSGHVLGQNTNREDLASRLIHASRISLAVGFIGTSIAITIGIIIGGLMGYFAGIVDLIGMRLVEIFEFIPTLFLLLMFVAFFPGDHPELIPGVKIQRLYMIMVIIGLTGWASYARFIRAEFLRLRHQDFVVAARACGLPLYSILFKHMLPNGVTPILVAASFGVASAILSEATLSFLGLGLIEEPSWGQALNQAAKGSSFIWWIALFPGLAIFLTVFSYNLIGEALRDAIDPHTQRLNRG